MSEHHKPNIKAYLFVFGALAVLTVVTVSVSHLRLPIGLAVFCGMLIAAVKAGLVASFFMHLKGERALIFGVLGLTLLFLAILFIIPATDSVATAAKRAQAAASLSPSAAPAEHHTP